MQVFDAVYKKGNMLQCKFSDTSIYPDYIGAEFPIGYHLINAIAYDLVKVATYYRNLIKAYITYIDNENETNFKKYESALLKIDDYCIYMHETTCILLSSIKKFHPDYSLNDLVDFMQTYFNMKDQFELIKQIRKIKKNGRIQIKECLILWNTFADMLLDKFDSDIGMLKKDITDVCKVPSKYNGLGRLVGLDVNSREHYFEMDFPVRISIDLGEATDSKFFAFNFTEGNSVSYSVAAFTTEQLMYYDFSLTLESNLPIKLCKNCNKPFIPKGRTDSLYCDRRMPGFKDKCSNIGALITYKNNLSDIESEFYATRRRYNTRVSRNPLLKTEFEVWKIKAKEKLTAYRNGQISADEFRNWFMDDEWMKI